MSHEDDEDRPRWRDADEDDDEPRDWEIEPEEEKEDRRPVLRGTAPLARLIFIGILIVVALGGIVLVVRVLGERFRG